jgi:hypothetical protein
MKPRTKFSGILFALGVAVLATATSCHKSISSVPADQSINTQELSTDDDQAISERQTLLTASAGIPPLPLTISKTAYKETYNLSTKLQTLVTKEGINKVQQFGTGKYATNTYFGLQKTKTTQQYVVVSGTGVHPAGTTSVQRWVNIYNDKFIHVYVWYDDYYGIPTYLVVVFG